ncbi:MAG TPA: hypothetical protein VGG64_04190 [Pirellulales bacterium]|jgi:hypothetical protein
MHSVQPDISGTSHVETDGLEYRAISVLALFALVLAVASVLAFAHPALWVMPLASVAVSLMALRRIAENPHRMLGRGIAIVSLLLALLLGAAAISRSAVSIARTRQEARLITDAWFDAVLHSRLETALELMQETGSRQSAGDDVVAHYRDDPKAAAALRSFAAMPLVRALRTVDGSATVRYLKTEEEVTLIVSERVTSLWAVTFERDGQPTTFLVRVLLKRHKKAPRLVNFWDIEKAFFVERPPAWL